MRIIIHKSVKISRTVVQLSTLFFCSEIRVPVYVLYNFSARFFWVGRPKRGPRHFRGQVYVVANNALPQYGTHISCGHVPPFPWSLFSLCFLRFLSFQSLFHSHLPSLPSFDTARGVVMEHRHGPSLHPMTPISVQSSFGQHPSVPWSPPNHKNGQHRRSASVCNSS